ncbi:MAG: DUF2334 domain-containing protein [Candidatus Bipolaricaulaceae bacterium]
MTAVNINRWGKAAAVLAALGLVSVGLIGAGPPLCVMEVWTGSQSYRPGGRVQLHMWLSVNADPSLPDIRGARLELELRQPFGGVVTLSTKTNITLRKGAEWEEPLITLPIAGEPFRDLGDYEVHAVLFDGDGAVLCRAFTAFTIKSVFGQAPSTQTLIVTSRRTQLTEPLASKLAVWLEAAYDTRVQVIYQEGRYESYQQGMYRDYDVLIYYGTDYAQGPPADLVVDIFEGEDIASKRVVWIGYHLDKVQAYLHLYGLRYGELVSSSRPAQLLYVDTGATFPFSAADRIRVEVISEELARARATLEGNPLLVSAKQTYAPQQGECFYFVGFHPTAFLKPLGAHLVFLDVLNEVYGIQRGKVALLRLEDVHAPTDPADLLAAAAYLQEQGVPFSLSLIPIYRDGKGGRYG